MVQKTSMNHAIPLVKALCVSIEEGAALRVPAVDGDGLACVDDEDKEDAKVDVKEDGTLVVDTDHAMLPDEELGLPVPLTETFSPHIPRSKKNVLILPLPPACPASSGT